MGRHAVYGLSCGAAPDYGSQDHGAAAHNDEVALAPDAKRRLHSFGRAHD
jgi:hypothetical protein